MDRAAAAGHLQRECEGRFMKVIAPADVLDEHDHFTGSVKVRRLFEGGGQDAARVVLVHFEAEARTFWHTHSGRQLLYIVDGTGQVQADGSKAETVEVGALVEVAPGEKHWHGAGIGMGEPMTHLAITVGATTWLEEVVASPGTVKVKRRSLPRKV
jgi:quercetin dioxygenase-like cupin family protein